MSFVYKGLEAEFERHLVTDAEVDQQLERLRQQTPKVRAVTGRAAQAGDELVLDYAGFCDGNAFEGGSAQRQTLVLGSGMFIPGFEEQLIGCNAGDEVTVEVTFPEQYHAESLAGKDAQFHCTVHEIRVKDTFELDDEFAREMGLETLDELREALRESIQQYSDERGQLDLEDRLLRQAAGTLDFAPSEEQVEAAMDEQMETLSAQLAQQGLSLEMYCRFTGKTAGELREESRPEARQSLLLRAAIERIVELERIEVTEEDMAQSLAAVCRRNGITMEQLQSVYDSDFETAVKRSVEMRKAMGFLRAAAVLTEKK